MKRAFPAYVALAIIACSSPDPSTPPAAANGSLPTGVVARVGPTSIGVEAVAQIASAQGISPREALAREVSDALYANGALADGLENSYAVRAAVRGLFAHIELETMLIEAGQKEPTDAEVAEATERHFVELDRPETFRVIHAVVRLPDKADSATKARARVVGERLAEHVARAKDESEFRALAESVERDGFEITVESLKPVASDGRVVDPDRPGDRQTPLLLPFARAASHLSQPGQKSGIVPTEFGFHTLMLLERLPPVVVPLDERRQRLRNEIVDDRARRLKKDLLRRLRSDVAASAERSADAILANVAAGRHEEP